MRLSARRGHDLLGAAGDGEPGVRAGGRHLGHGRHHAPQRRSMLVEPPAHVRPPGVVEEREGQVGLEDRVADLGGVEVHVHRERTLLRRPERPLRPLARLLQAADRGQRLRAGDQCEVEAACPDLPGRLGGEHVGHRSRRCPSSAAAPATRPAARPAGPRRRRTARTASRRRRCSRARRGSRAAPLAVPASARAAARAIRSHMSSGSGAAPPADTASASSGCQVWRATPMMQVARGSGLNGVRAGQARDLPGMAMARSAMMFFWISVEPPPIVE